MRKVFNGVALFGGAFSIAVSLDYLNGLLQWGLHTQWHFMYVGGWGSRFLYHLELIIVASLLWLPSRLSKPKPRMVTALLILGFILFIAAAVTETVLSRSYP
jgi:hypothetical protein